MEAKTADDGKGIEIGSRLWLAGCSCVVLSNIASGDGIHGTKRGFL